MRPQLPQMTQEVVSCGDCPFARDVTPEILHDAPNVVCGHPMCKERTVAEDVIDKEQDLPSEPPDFCPLRSAPIRISLAKEKS